MKFYISYEGYCKSSGVSIIEADSRKDLFQKIHEQHQYPKEKNSWNELELKQQINKQDGCDYIISIISEKGKLIFECDN